MDAEPAGFVGGSSHHPSRSVVAHSQRDAPQFRMVALLNRGEERIHIDMYDFPFSHILSADEVIMPPNSLSQFATKIQNPYTTCKRRTEKTFISYGN
jgi:hypothetical protein